MEDNYPKAYKEVIEILNYLPKESIEKIPQTMINTFKTKMDQSYNFKVNINKNFEEQNLLEETKAILANIFRDYWATPYQKERIKEKEKYDRQKVEEEKREQFNPNNIFKGAKQQEKMDIELKDNIQNLPIEIKKEKFYEKILNFFKKIFRL